MYGRNEFRDESNGGGRSIIRDFLSKDKWWFLHVAKNPYVAHPCESRAEDLKKVNGMLVTCNGKPEWAYEEKMM